MRTIRTLATAVLWSAVASACTSETPQVASETTAATPPPESAAAPPVRDSGAAGGTLAMRSEAQDHLDRALNARLRRDGKAMAIELRAAAQFFVAAADSASSQIRTDAGTTARELNGLAREAESGELASEVQLERLFARANRTEAARHHARAEAAWTAHDTARTGEELLMAVDHLERAVKDAKLTRDTTTDATIDRGRRTGTTLLRGATAGGAGVTAPDIASTLAAVGTEIGRVAVRLRRGAS